MFLYILYPSVFYALCFVLAIFYFLFLRCIPSCTYVNVLGCSVSIPCGIYLVFLCCLLYFFPIPSLSFQQYIYLHIQCFECNILLLLQVFYYYRGNFQASKFSILNSKPFKQFKARTLFSCRICFCDENLLCVLIVSCSILQWCFRYSIY